MAVTDADRNVASSVAVAVFRVLHVRYLVDGAGKVVQPDKAANAQILPGFGETHGVVGAAVHEGAGLTAVVSRH